VPFRRPFGTPRRAFPTTKSCETGYYRLVIKMYYRKGLVVIEWVGTHAEYTKKGF